MKTLRNTKALKIVESVIQKNDSPISSAEIIESVQKLDTNINRATIFRVIKRLAESEQIFIVNFGDGKMRYEWKGQHHHHLVCTNCGKITAIHVCDAESMAINQARDVGFQIHSHSLEYFGLCKNCKQ